MAACVAGSAIAASGGIRRPLNSRCLSCGLFLLQLPAISVGHGIMKSPKPRSGTVDSPISPLGDVEMEGCNGASRGSFVAVVAPGMEVVVRHDVTIPHGAAPGVRLALQNNNGVTFLDGAVPVNYLEDDDGLSVGAVGAHDIGCARALRCARMISGCAEACNAPFFRFVVPGLKSNGAVDKDAECDRCVLQWIWQSADDNGGYISCADIKVVDGAAPCGVFTREPGSTVYYTGDCPSLSEESRIIFIILGATAGLFVGTLVMFTPQCKDNREHVRHFCNRVSRCDWRRREEDNHPRLTSRELRQRRMNAEETVAGPGPQSPQQVCFLYSGWPANMARVTVTVSSFFAKVVVMWLMMWSYARCVSQSRKLGRMHRRRQPGCRHSGLVPGLESE